MQGTYKNKLDGSIIEVYQAPKLLIVGNKRTKSVSYFAKFISSLTKQDLEPFELTENFNKFGTWEKF